MSREMCTSRRIRTNTPLQALVTLNDPVYVEAAAALARRMQEDGGASVDGRIRAGYRRALLIDPPHEALRALRQLYEGALAEYRADDANLAGALFKNAAVAGTAAAKPPPDSDDPEVAALTVVASAIMNLDSFLTKE